MEQIWKVHAVYLKKKKLENKKVLKTVKACVRAYFSQTATALQHTVAAAHSLAISRKPPCVKGG